MPNRILKESICTSETIDRLTPEEEVFFYRLLVVCDDFGRTDARPSVLRAQCFPLRVHKVKESSIETWLIALENAGLLKPYEVEGKPYVQVTTWDAHQHRRAKYSKFPSPENICDHMISNDGDCEQENADERRFTRGIEESRNRGIDHGVLQPDVQGDLETTPPIDF